MAQHGLPQFARSKMVSNLVMSKFDIFPENTLSISHHCTQCPARNKAVCSVFDPQISSVLFRSMVHKRFGKGDIIWREGETAGYFAIVVSGAVKLVQTFPDGKQQIVGMLFASDCVGDLFVDEHTSFAEAVSQTELCCFPQKQFEHALETDPKLEHFILERTFKDLVATRKWLATLSHSDATERVANFLVSMMQKSVRMSCPHATEVVQHPMFQIPMSRADIADYLGMSIETVSRKFTQLKNAGIISYHGSRTIKVLEPDALCKMTGT